MDLSELNPAIHADVGATLEITNPQTGAILMGSDGKPVTVDLYGLQSTQLRKRLPANLINKVLGINSGGMQSDKDAAIAEVAILATRGTSGNFTLNGEQFAFSAEAVKALYNSQGWMARQVLDFVIVQRNFTPAA